MDPPDRRGGWQTGSWAGAEATGTAEVERYAGSAALLFNIDPLR